MDILEGRLYNDSYSKNNCRVDVVYRRNDVEIVENTTIMSKLSSQETWCGSILHNSHNFFKRTYKLAGIGPWGKWCWRCGSACSRLNLEGIYLDGLCWSCFGGRAWR